MQQAKPSDNMRLSAKSPTACATPSTTIYIGLFEKEKLSQPSELPRSSINPARAPGTPVRVAMQLTEQSFASGISGLADVLSCFTTLGGNMGRVHVLLLESSCCSLSCLCCKPALLGPWKPPPWATHVSLNCFLQTEFTLSQSRLTSS